MQNFPSGQSSSSSQPRTRTTSTFRQNGHINQFCLLLMAIAIIKRSSYQTCTARPPSRNTGELILKACSTTISLHTLVYISVEVPLNFVPHQKKFESLKKEWPAPCLGNLQAQGTLHSLHQGWVFYIQMQTVRGCHLRWFFVWILFKNKLFQVIQE